MAHLLTHACFLADVVGGFVQLTVAYRGLLAGCAPSRDRYVC